MSAVTSRKIYVRLGDDNGNYEWYDLKECLDAALEGGGGTTYTAGDGIVIDDDEISIYDSYFGSMAWKSASDYSPKGHTHSQYIESGDAVLGSSIKATSGIYMENKTHSMTTSATWVACNDNAPSGMTTNAYRLYIVSSSSKRYKDHLEYVDIDDASRILDIPVVKFKYKDGYLVDDDEFVGKPIYGLYAEDVEKVVPEAVFHQEGKVENWKDRTILTLMLRVIQDQQKRIEELEKKLAQ